ncbi:MAG: dihydrolipoyl dehydrogenase [Candidatus Gastranaerophilales bacterium]|nr:dihydrolipoyl dehydrogenase [Candidatus Gastranaerophilales bacterium]
MFDIGIIGSGPAGYTAAIRACQNGLSAVLFEKNQIGGTCLNKGCIPVKTILNSCRIYSELMNVNKFGIIAENVNFDFTKIQQRQKTVSEKIRKSLTMLIKSYGIMIIEEEANIVNEHIISTKTGSYEVKNIIIATGSRPNILKFKGNYSNDFVLTSDDILNLTELPSSMLIVGSGAIGIEWARILSSLNVKVSIVEIMEKLIPSADYEVSERIARLLRKNKIDFYTSTSVQEIEGKTVTLSNKKILDVDFLLLGAGRTAEICTGNIVNNLNKKQYINVDSNFKTNYNNIYAIGDVTGKSLLAHSAIKQAESVINYIVSGKSREFNKNLVPSVIFGTPEIASIGLTEQELIEQKIKYKKSFFPVSALGKAYADDKIEGFIKILATDDKILGAHIISEEASALIEQIAIAMTNNIKPKELQNVIFAHPTYSEGVLESILALDNMAINLPKKTEVKT